MATFEDYLDIDSSFEGSESFCGGDTDSLSEDEDSNNKTDDEDKKRRLLSVKRCESLGSCSQHKPRSRRDMLRKTQSVRKTKKARDDFGRASDHAPRRPRRSDAEVDDDLNRANDPRRLSLIHI